MAFLCDLFTIFPILHHVFINYIALLVFIYYCGMAEQSFPLFQEELATVFKSVALHNDALLQYERLDALFSQFVVNKQVKGSTLMLF